MTDYLKGKENWFIRMYFYLSNGLLVINNFRNLILGIFALYVVLKLANPIYLVLMFLAALPVLTLIGYYTIHRMNKVNEWLSMKFATHFAIKQYNLNEEQTELLREIRDSLSPEKPLPDRVKEIN